MPERMKRLWGEQDAGEVEMGGERMTGRGKHGLRAAAVLLGAMILLSGCAGARESDAVSNAMLAIGDRDFEGAVKTLEAAEKDGEHSRSLFRALGIAEMGMGDYQSAAEYLEKARDTFPVPAGRTTSAWRLFTSSTLKPQPGNSWKRCL